MGPKKINKHSDLFRYSTASGSRGGAPGAPPSNGREPMIFYAQNAQFSQFFSTLAIHFKHNFNRNMARTR